MVINETVVEFTQCSFTTLNKTIKFLVLAKETSIELVLLKCHVHCGHSRYTGKRKYNILYNKMKQSSWQISFLSYYTWYERYQNDNSSQDSLYIFFIYYSTRLRVKKIKREGNFALLLIKNRIR